MSAALKAEEERLIRILVAIAAELLAKLSAKSVPIINVAVLAVDAVLDLLQGRTKQLAVSVAAAALGPVLGPIFQFTVGISIARGMGKELAAELKAKSIEPYTQTRWMTRQVEVYDEAAIGRVCTRRAVKVPGERSEVCTIGPTPGWTRRQVSLGISGPLAGQASIGGYWEKIQLMPGLRAEVWRGRFIEWREVKR